MIEMLKEGDEAECIEDASIGASTVSIIITFTTLVLKMNNM